MIEIRTYEGDGADAAEMMGRAWRAAYGGRSWCPFWDAEYLRWQLLADRPGGRDFLVAAYDGRKLAGCFFAERATFRADGRNLAGTIGGWFTVDPEAKVPRLGLRITEELRSRHLAHDVAFMLAYVNGKPATAAHRFWAGYARLYPQQIRFVRRVGYWVRVLNPKSLRPKCLHRFEKFGAWVHGVVPLLWPPRRTARDIRAFKETDLDACGKLAADATLAADLAVQWSPERLSVQLGGGGFPRTFVLDRPGAPGPAGLINYHRFGLLGADVVSAGLIDLLAATNRPFRDRRRLLRDALARMAREGLDAAIALRAPMFPARLMLSCGFWPVPEADHLVYVFPHPDLKLPPAARPCVLFR